MKKYSIIMVDKSGRMSRIASGMGILEAIGGAIEANRYGYGRKARIVSDIRWFAYNDGMLRSAF